MLVAVQSLGSIWTARGGRTDAGGTNSARRGAYYNTTGVLAGDKLRNRSCIYGHVRVDECSGFHPLFAVRLIHRVYESEGVTVRSGRNKLFLRRTARTSCGRRAWILPTVAGSRLTLLRCLSSRAKDGAHGAAGLLLSSRFSISAFPPSTTH